MWFGRDKPNMTSFLSSFVKRINEYTNDGIACSINNEVKNIKIFALCCCVDSVARDPMQGIVKFNGYFGCNWCLQRGESVPTGKGHTLKYPIPNMNEEIRLRTEEETLVHLQHVLDTGETVFGVKSVTPLLNLRYFNIIDGFVPDPMYCISLSVVKQFTEMWLNSSGKDYSLNKEEIALINEAITSFKVPSHLARLSRSITDRKFWKSREWENWLMFYSLPILEKITRTNPRFEAYYEHWQFLVEAFYLLMKECVTINDLRTANYYLRQFIANAEILYSKQAITFNLHQLSHLVQSVAKW